MFSFYSGPRIWCLRDVDFLPMGSFKCCIFPVGVLTGGKENCGRGLLAAGAPGAIGVGIWLPGSLDIAHRDLARCWQVAVLRQDSWCMNRSTRIQCL